MTTTINTDPAIATYSIDDLATTWATHADTIRALIKSGALRASRVGRQVRIRRTDAVAYLDATVIAPAAAFPTVPVEVDADEVAALRGTPSPLVEHLTAAFAAADSDAAP